MFQSVTHGGERSLEVPPIVDELGPFRSEGLKALQLLDGAFVKNHQDPIIYKQVNIWGMKSAKTVYFMKQNEGYLFKHIHKFFLSFLYRHLKTAENVSGTQVGVLIMMDVINQTSASTLWCDRLWLKIYLTRTYCVLAGRPW